MKTHKLTSGYLLVFKRGELLMQTLQAFLKEQNIKAAWFTGLGGASAAEFGLYNMEMGEYRYKTFAGPLEITNLIGNVSEVDSNPFTHAHVTVADKSQAAYGGHLKELTVKATCEVNLTVFNEPLVRSLDKETGLNLL